MGSRVIHYCVGNEILKRAELEANQFMLGNLAPDAYDPNRGGSLISHFRIPEDIMEHECVDIDTFTSKYESQMSDDFVLGYYCHLITDNLWLKDAFKKYGHLGPEERSAAVKLLYADYWVLNTLLIDRYKLELRAFEPQSHILIDEIGIDFLNSLISSLTNDFGKKTTDTTLRELNLSEIIDFIENAVNECISGIRKLRDTKIVGAL